MTVASEEQSMRFYSRSKDESRPIDQTKQSQKPYNVSMTDRDYSDMRQDSVTLKVWLPEILEQQLGEMTSYLNTSLSDLIRQILFQHLYGRYDLVGLIERQKHIEDKDFDMPRYSIKDRVEDVPSPYQNKVAGVKVYMPERMKKDLEQLAAVKYQTLSEYVRSVIMTHLFGVVNADDTQSTLTENIEEGYS